MTTLTTIADFRNGDLLSASKLNELARNIDVVASLDDQRYWPIDSGGNMSHCFESYTRPDVVTRPGWINTYYFAHNGNQAYFFHGVDGIGGVATLTYNDWSWQVNAFADFTTELPSLPRWTIASSVVYGGTNSAPQENVNVRILHATQSNAAAMPTLPTFSSGASSAAHLNTVKTAIVNAHAYLNQPVPCMYYPGEEGVGWLAKNRNGYIGHFKRRKNTNKLFIRASFWLDGLAIGQLATIKINNITIWEFDPPNTNSYNAEVNGFFDIPDVITEGNWYKVTIIWQRGEDGANRMERMYIYDLYEQAPSQGTTAETITRWQHGDTINGASGTEPLLVEMNTALNSLGTLRWINTPCRAATSFVQQGVGGPCTSQTEYIDGYISYRIHRWLAYQNYAKLLGGYANASLLWWTGSNWQSVSMPSITSPGYFDLESTPVKVGMRFRVEGVKYAIQVPEYP
jgi:hypothetical protein